MVSGIRSSSENIYQKPKFIHSLKGRVLLGIFTSLTIICFLTISIYLYSSYKDELSKLYSRGEMLVQIQGNALADPMWNMKKKQIQKYVDLLAEDPNFYEASVHDSAGIQIAKYKTDDEVDKKVEFYKEISFENFGNVTNLGSLKLTLNKDQIIHNFYNKLYIAIGILIIIQIIVFLIIYGFLNRMIIRPLSRMMTTMAAVAEGDLSQKVKIERNDEFGNLARVFNKMTNDLKEIYNTIEQRVFERTIELKKSYQQLQKAEKKSLESANQLQIEKDKSERLLRDALETSPAALLLLDHNDCVQIWNKRFTELLEEEHTKILKTGASAFDIFAVITNFNPELWRLESPTKQSWRACFEGSYNPNESYELQLSNDRWVRINEHTTQDNETVIMFVDITTLKKREKRLATVNQEIALQTEKLRISEQKYALAAQGSNDGLWDWNVTSGELIFSPRCLEMLGYSSNENSFNTMDDWIASIHPDYQNTFRKILADHISGQAPRLKSEYLMRHHDGTYHWMLTRGLAARDKDDKAVRMAGSQSDITMQKTYEQELIHTAYHDALTGLPNRDLFIKNLKDAIDEKAQKPALLTAILFLDLDRFKVINDSLGHDIGDKLLIGIAKRLKKCLRPHDSAARLGGDEFTVLLRDIRDLEEAKNIANRILEQLAEPFNLNGNDVFASASIGITLLTKEFKDSDSLLRNADLAMYRAKSAGRGRFELYDSEMHTQVKNQLEIETELRRAVDRDEILLYYQPIIDLHTKELIGLEALVRWKHREKGMIPLSDFLPVAEETGMILPLGEHIFSTACQQLNQWKRTIGDDKKLAVSINISARQIRDLSYMQKLLEVLKQFSFDPGFIKIEVTESAIMSNLEEAEWILNQIKELGADLAIDDFGTGYSSFSYLHRFPFDILKLDHSFIQKIPEFNKTYMLVRGIISLSHDIGIKVIAEGIETEYQQIHLTKMNCDYAQGYYYAKPMPVKEATEYILTSKLASHDKKKPAALLA
jgi:diguanylate cyclase (GGDEF)-like protein/PAS domain S-box-containing protein